VRCKAWELADAVEWGLTQAVEAGYSQVVVACEPTGHRWRVLDQIAAEHGVALVCVQPLLVARAREAEDFTRNKNDDTDAMIIARLVTELRCYLPERADPSWARLRHLGARRAGLVVAAGAARQQVRDLLECAWPAVLGAAADPLESQSWRAAVTVVLDRVGAGGDLSVITRWGWDRFAAAVRAELGATRWSSRIVRAVFDAATDPALSRVGVAGQRAGVLERVGFALTDLAVSTIPGVSAIGAATILAETGDPTRFSSARALVKHAGLCPRDNASGSYQGMTGISGRGRPELRLAAWRAVFPALHHNPVLAARHAHLTGRAANPLTDTQARVGSRPACCASCTP
jgi:transposase